MRLTAKTSEFTALFTTMNMSGLFNPVVVSVKKDIISMVGRDPADTVLSVQKYKNITIEDGTDTSVVFDPEEMLNTFKLFKPEDEISVNILENKIVVSNSDGADINDVVTIPQIDINTVDSPEFPFRIVKGLPIITNKATGEEIEFNINATIPVKYLAELVKRANYTGINPRLYKLVFGDGKLKGMVGEQNDFQKSVVTTFNITGEGEGELLFGAGLEEMITTLSGEVTINATPGAPAWVTYKTDKNIVYILIAPAMQSDE